MIEIYSVEVGEYSLTLNTDRVSIWADNGRTFATLTAVLKDENDRGVAGEEIQFSATFGIVQPSAITDSMGRATAVFTDTGIALYDSLWMPYSSVVTARSQARDVSAEVRIMILEPNPVCTINIYVNSRQLTAQDSTLFRVTLYCRDGSPAPPGTEVHFYAAYGRFAESMIITQGYSGIDNWYFTGNQAVTDTIIISVMSEGDTVCCFMTTFDLISGPPAVVVVRANPTELRTNDPASRSEIIATVMDTRGNPVRRGTYVTFRSTLGTINHSAITDEHGDAIAMLTTGTQAGLAEITATTQGRSGPISARATVVFISGSPHSIELSVDPLEIRVAETGGITSSAITATVRDPNGNLIAYPASVVFELINEPPPPAGCTIGGPGRQVARHQTSNGYARAVLNSGEEIGGKLIRAYTWPDSVNQPDRIIEAIFCNVMVVSGPPFQYDIDVDGRGEDAGGGAWSIEVSARVWDMHRNPVADRVSVAFTVDPEIATIDPGYTGNNDRHGRSVQGIAYADLIYHSVNTYSDVEISADVQVPGGIYTEREYVLPLQQGELTLQVDPANWMFDDENQAEIRCWASLMDGHRVLINNAPILFTTSRGRLFWQDFSGDRLVMFYPDPARKFTGVQDEHNNEAPGQATVYLFCSEEDIFIDPFQNQMSVNVEACIENLNVRAEPRFVIFTRR